MRKSTHTRQYQLLLELLIAARMAKGLSQTQVAKKLERPQSFVAKFEGGERRLDVVELISVARVLGADPLKIFAKVVDAS